MSESSHCIYLFFVSNGIAKPGVVIVVVSFIVFMSKCGRHTHNFLVFCCCCCCYGRYSYSDRRLQILDTNVKWEFYRKAYGHLLIAHKSYAMIAACRSHYMPPKMACCLLACIASWSRLRWDDERTNARARKYCNFLLHFFFCLPSIAAAIVCNRENYSRLGMCDVASCFVQSN